LDRQKSYNYVNELPRSGFVLCLLDFKRDIRKEFVERDKVECVMLLPENLFYNTSAPGIIMALIKPSRTRVKCF
jgi:type I restriction-modification system DNA methylase subunit